MLVEEFMENAVVNLIVPEKEIVVATIEVVKT
jgi:hypothetical protein